MIKFTPEQQAIVQSLKDFKPQLTPGGCYAVMTTRELHHMRSEEFIQLCEELIPAHHDFIVAYAMRKGSYLGDAIRKTLVKYIQETYVPQRRRYKAAIPCKWSNKNLETCSGELPAAD